MSQGVPSQHSLIEKTVPTSPLLTAEEIEAQEATAVASLPEADQEAVERSAGEGMVGTPVEASSVPTRVVTGSAGLETPGGLPIVTVVVDLVGTPPTYSGTMTVPHDDGGIEAPGDYRLRLADDESLAIRVTERVGEMYAIETLEAVAQEA